MDTQLSAYNVAADLQNVLCGNLNASPDLQGLGIEVYAENSKDIEFNIRNAIMKQGMAVVCMTPKAQNLGHDGNTTTWQFTDLEFNIVENVPVNRASNKERITTALDVAYYIQAYLASPHAYIGFGKLCPKGIEQGEDGNLLVVKATFDTWVQSGPDAIVPQPPQPPPPGSEIIDSVLLKTIGSYSTEEQLDIPDDFFRDCSSLTTVSVPNVRIIGANSFRNCVSLTSLNISGLVRISGTYAFSGCNGIEEICLPNLSAMGSQSFQDCGGLRRVSLPLITSIPTYCFRSQVMANSHLESFSAPRVTQIGNYGLYGNGLITEYDFPELSSIGQYGFANNRGLERIHMPKIVSIGTNAFFYDEKLTRIVIPQCDSIGNAAFSSCSALEELDFSARTKNSIPSLGSTNAVTSMARDYRILVPQRLYSQWIAATNWSSSSVKSHIVAV